MIKTKDEVQIEAIEALDALGGSGILCMATGTGKSKIPIMIAQRELTEITTNSHRIISPSEYKILICVPTEKLRDVNWMKEFEKWNAESIWEINVERTCYVSMPKIQYRHFDMVILDECHNITEFNSIFFKQNICNRIIGLTATMPDSLIKLDILKSIGLNISYTVTMDEAVEWQLVSPYAITVVKVPLEKIRKTAKGGTVSKPFSVTEFNAYWYLTDQINDIRNKIKSANDESIRRTKEEQLSREIFLMNLPNIYIKKQMYERKRMHLVYNLQSKLDAAKFILSHMSRKKRTLIFAGSIKHAEQLCNESFHSKSGKKSTSFERFCNSVINWLSCVNSLNEGHNIPELDVALVVQLNSKPLKMIQRIGRVVRFRENHKAKIIIIIAEGTVDEEWSKTALSEFNNENIKYINFNELKTLYQ